MPTEITDFEVSGSVSSEDGSSTAPSPPTPTPTPSSQEPQHGTDATRTPPDLSTEPAEGHEPETADGETRARDDAGRFTRETRHRAKSQRASADDVPRIRELTKRWRETEDRLAATLKEIETLKASHTPSSPTLPPTPTPVRPPDAFTKPQPVFEEAQDIQQFIADSIAWHRDKDAHERAVAAASASSSEAAARQAAWEEETRAAWRTRVEAFKATQPGFDEAMKAANFALSKVTEVALLLDKSGPAMAWWLSQHPDDADRVYVETAGLDLTDAHVALVQRRLAKLMAADPTGAAPVSTTATPAPKPPTPVRTVPMKSSPEIPGDEGSLEDHIRSFPIKPRHAR